MFDSAHSQCDKLNSKFEENLRSFLKGILDGSIDKSKTEEFTNQAIIFEKFCTNIH